MTHAPATSRASWHVADGVELSLDEPRLMGIVNATPDSFSEGGMNPSCDALVGQALRYVEEGAAIVDVGGESTRPGAVRVEASEQIDRVVPVIEELRACTDVLISVDTTRAAVADAALNAGANVVNDVSAGLEDEAMFDLACSRRFGIVLMHHRMPPETESFSDAYDEAPHYEDVSVDVRRFLVNRAHAAQGAGIRPDAIVIDPGLGFGKSVEQNFELIRRLRELTNSGYPVLGAASRKSFIGHVTGIAVPRDRVVGSTAVTVAQYFAGVRIFRVHDVAAHREALRVAHAIAFAPVPVAAR